MPGAARWALPTTPPPAGSPPGRRHRSPTSTPATMPPASAGPPITRTPASPPGGLGHGRQCLHRLAEHRPWGKVTGPGGQSASRGQGRQQLLRRPRRQRLQEHRQRLGAENQQRLGQRTEQRTSAIAPVPAAGPSGRRAAFRGLRVAWVLGRRLQRFPTLRRRGRTATLNLNTAAIGVRHFRGRSGINRCAGWIRVDAVCFGFLVPFFFVTSGMKFDLGGLWQSPTTLLLVNILISLIITTSSHLFSPNYFYPNLIAANSSGLDKENPD